MDLVAIKDIAALYPHLPTEIVGKPPPSLQAKQQGHGSQANQQDTAIGSIEVLANESGHRGLLL